MSLMNLIPFLVGEGKEGVKKKGGTKLLGPTFELDVPLEICEWP